MEYAEVSFEEAYHAILKCQNKQCSFESSQKQYSKRSRTYDQQHKVLNLQYAIIAAELCLKHASNTANTTLLDVGAGKIHIVCQSGDGATRLISGTGNVDMLLRKKGFWGHIDLLDANPDMLDVARKKEINSRKIILHVLDKSGSIPVDPESYDVVICVGSLHTNNIPANCLNNILLMVKHGGLLIFDEFELNTPYAKELKSVIDDLVNGSKMYLLEMKKYNTIDIEPYIPSIMYAFKKV